MSGEAKATILVVEDSRALREGLALNFGLRGYRVLTAATGNDGMKMVFAEKPDLVILDVGLPGPSGLDILYEVREQELPTPVLVLSARGSVEQKIEGLELGADDYLAKPFELPELVARVEALLRRSKGGKSPQAPVSFADVVVDPDARRVTRKGAEVRMSAREFALLCLFVRSPGTVFSRETILERVWGWDFEGTPRTVDNYVVALRKLLEADPSNPTHIKTVRQLGYRFDP